MPLNKLDNFIKNTEGRILYVSPSDLDSTDNIDNQGNSLARPFKTLQRALIESARFSYVKGNSNDIIEKTTILLMPGEHEIDNRPGLAIYNNSDLAYVRTKDSSGTGTSAQSTLDLNLGTVFDLTQEDNVLYKFNSVDGGVVVPRGTSIVGLDLRKTKLRPKYVPNPTDGDVPNTSIFKVTGSCYFWQFSIFDGNDLDLVYTDPLDFSDSKKASPTFSHNKLTVFEYCDGVNNVDGYDSTDLDMYYYKVGNAYNQGSTRPIEDSEKYPESELAFEPKRPEWEIVGAFATDPFKLSKIQAGTDSGVSSTVTVTTKTPHNLQVGTPIKIRGVIPTSYNISAFVTWVSNTDDKVFTYTLPNPDPTLGEGNISAATVTIETDTVEGASPYIFNCSMRSVYGMNGLLADGSKASGFRSMVVAQFTGISLQKDDRAFTKYDPNSRDYNSISYSAVNGADLSGGSSSINTRQVYHLDSEAVYRPGWETSHIKITNDAILQIVSVFAIGYTKHFEAQTGGDASITNSNSNFGQLALVSDGFKKEAFDKDDQSYITSIISPRSIESTEEKLDWLSIDTATTATDKLYLYGFGNKNVKPPVYTQGYKVGARLNDKIYVDVNNTPFEASIVIPNSNNTSSELSYTVTGFPSGSSNNFTIGNNSLITGEKVIVISDDGDLPENIEDNTVYYVINMGNDNDIQLASSEANAINEIEITVSGGTNLHIISRVTDKEPGESGHPVQYDDTANKWYINVNSSGNGIYTQLAGISDFTDVSYIKRKEDTRSLDEKIYKLRVVVPKTSTNAKNPESGFIIQETSNTGYKSNSEFTQDDTLTGLVPQYNFKRNLSYISTCTYDNVLSIATVRTDLPHKLNVGDTVIVKNVQDSANTIGAANSSYNGTFKVSSIPNDMEFGYNDVDVNGLKHTPGSSMTGITTIRTIDLPRFERNDLQKNLYIYRNEVIKEYIKGVQDGVYHLYVLSSDNTLPKTFTNLKYSQNVRDLYPQMDMDNPNDNPQSSKSFAVRSPLGKVVTNDLRKSLTRESTNEIVTTLGIGLTISAVSAASGGISTITFAQRHGFAGIVTGSDKPGANTNYTAGLYQNVKLFTDSELSDWRGTTAKVNCTGGNVDTAELISPGCGYNPTESGSIELYYDTNQIGGDGNARFYTSASGISSCLGNVLQFTGSGIATDSYATINSIINDTQIAVAKTDGDPDITTDQYAFSVAPLVIINGTPSSSTANDITTTTFNTNGAHGLVVGNSFKLLDSNNNNLGDFIVNNEVDINTFTAITTGNDISDSKYILKHGLSANEKVSDKTDENLAVRANSIFENEIATLDSTITDSQTQIQISLPTNLNGIIERFPYGSYIQIEDEIMRIASPNLDGLDNDKITVLRGAFATNSKAHLANSLIKKIKPIAIEFRRPSILRASGHTFEYLGYGPGNYSTSLPQVQDRTLSEREEFLAQSQEKGGGIVVYTGMNSKGDFYIGNLKKSSATGEEVTYDTPVPTITGQDPARLSAVFDEVTIKERIVVEGGASNQILSQFDGPVTINKSLKVDDNTDINGILELKNEQKATSTTTGALQVAGGVGIGTSVFVGGGVHVSEEIDVTGTSKFNGNVQVGDSISLDVGTAIIDATGYRGSGTELTGLPGGANPQQFNQGVKATWGTESTGNEFIDIYHSADSGHIHATSTEELKISTEHAEINLKAWDTPNISCTRYHTSLNGGTSNTGLRLTTTDTGVQIGNSEETGAIVAYGDITAFQSSDRRLKDNISPIKQALDKVNSISGNTFDWNEKSQYEGKGDTGVIAQEIEALNLPGVTTTRESGYKAVRYEKLVPLLIEAIKELSAKVDNLEQKLSDK